MQGSVEQNIRQIAALKGIKDKDVRNAELFGLVLGFCLNGLDDYSSKENALFGDIMVRLMRTMDSSKKVEIAGQIASSDSVPVKMVRYLALEAIEIAETVLMHSPILSDNDLLVVIRFRGHEHMVAISSRENLSAEVSAELVKCGDKTVFLALINNSDATIFNKSFQQLGENVKNDETMFVSLLKRSDIPDLILRQIVRDAGPPIRPFLMSGGLQYLASFLDGELKREEKTDQVDIGELRAMMSKLLRGKPEKKLDEDDFIKVIKENSLIKTVCIFSHMTNIPLGNAMELFTNRNAEPVVLACRAIDLQRDTVAALLKVGPWQVTLTKESRNDFLKIFDKLKQATAKNVFNLRLQLYSAET